MEGMWLEATLSLLGCRGGSQPIACFTLVAFPLVLTAILNTSLYPGSIKDQNRRTGIMQWG